MWFVRTAALPAVEEAALTVHLEFFSQHLKCTSDYILMFDEILSQHPDKYISEGNNHCLIFSRRSEGKQHVSVLALAEEPV